VAKAYVITLAGKEWHAPKIATVAERLEDALLVFHGEVVRKITSHGGFPVWLVRCERKVLQEFAPHLHAWGTLEKVEVRLYEVPLA